MSKKKDKEELLDSLNSTIISYSVEIEHMEDRLKDLKKEKDILEKRLDLELE